MSNTDFVGLIMATLMFVAAMVLSSEGNLKYIILDFRQALVGRRLTKLLLSELKILNRGIVVDDMKLPLMLLLDDRTPNQICELIKLHKKDISEAVETMSIKYNSIMRMISSTSNNNAKLFRKNYNDLVYFSKTLNINYDTFLKDCEKILSFDFDIVTKDNVLKYFYNNYIERYYSLADKKTRCLVEKRYRDVLGRNFSFQKLKVSVN